MNKSNSISFRRYYEKRHLLLAIATLSLTCNTITFAQSESNPNSNSAIATPTNIKELSGKPIDFSHYKDYITTDRPSEATGKMFLLYNIGTGKFLNMGSYWGTHAVLNDVPRPFWLQRRNEKYQKGQTDYLRYPDTIGSPGTFIYDFFTLPTYQIGAKEGSKLSYVKYNYVRIVNTNDNTYETLLENKQGDGKAITLAENKAIDFDNHRIEAEIDLTNVKETYDGQDNTSSGKIENIFSVGQDISKWDSKGGAIDLHIYASKTSSGIYKVYLNFMDKDYNEVTHRKVVQIKDGSIAKIVIDKGCITVNGVACRPGGTSDDYTNPTHHILALRNLQIGSKIGDTHNEAIYTSVKKISYEKNSEDVENDLLSSIKKDNDGKFEIPVTGNLNNRSIEATIDLSTCGDEQEGILSIGTNISNWGTTIGIRAENIHFYYTKSKKELVIDAAYRDGDAYNESASKHYSRTIDYSEPLTISLSPDGLKLNGTTFDNITSDATSKHVLDYLTHTATSFGIGSKEKKTTATYIKLSYIDKISLKKVETPVFEAKDAASDGSWMKEVSLDLESGESLVADIDITDCKTLKQDLLSIGNDISTWSKEADKHNLHIYLRKNDFSDDNLYIEYVDENYCDEMKHAFTVKKDEVTGKAILHVELTKDDLLINGKGVFTDESPVPAIYYSRDRIGDVVRFEQHEGDDHIFKIDKNGKYIIATDNNENANGIYRPTNGYIYAYTNLQDKTFSYFISSKFELGSGDNNSQGVFLGWAPYFTNNQRWGSVGLYGDRDLPQAECSYDVAVDATQWFFEPVSYMEDGKPVNAYKLRLKMTDVKVPYRLGELGYDKYDFHTQSGDFYLQATSEQVFGNDLCDYGGGIDLNASTKVNPEDYTEVNVLNTYPTDKPELGYWKLIDVEEYNGLFKAANTEMSQMLDLTFQLRDPDFSRRSVELPNWKMDEGLNGKIRIGYDNFNKKTTNEIDYSKDDGSGTDAGSARASNHGRYMGVDIRGKDAKGNFCQTITLYNAGWYAIRCGGFSSAGAALFAQYGNEVLQKPLHQLTQAEYNFLQKGNGMKWPYENSMPMYNAIVAMNDEQADGDGTKTGKNGAKVVEKYTNQIVFFVDPDMLKANGGRINITFGISLPSDDNIDQQSEDGSSYSNNAEETPYTASAWTVFDNFHLLFGGNDGEPYLILDEDDENVDHLDNTIHKYRSGIVDGKDINKKLYLHRTFTAGKWNSIMLPVGLTKAQYDEMFKEVDQDGATIRVGSEAAPLAELTKLTDRTINFTTVKEETLYEGKDANGNLYDKTPYWLKPMTPYIVKPTISGGSDTEGYTAHLYTWESSGKKYLEKNVGGTKKTGERCFVIEHINMVEGVVKAEQITDGFTFRSKWDFAHITTPVYTIKDGKAELADCPYVMKGQVADQNGTMTAYGHLAKNFTLDSNGKRQLSANRASMAYSYSVSGNKLTYMKAGAASKGFRCWFQYNKGTDTSASAKPMLALDGIDMTTGIEDIIANDEGESPITRFAQGIYTMDGRLLSKNAGDIKKFPKGLYIVNGKKQIVK